jgi:ComEC/Rec2-related protein
MITGNTGGISTETLSSFRYGGVAHIFAVSGLHIGVVYGALALLFKKLRMGKYLSTTLIIAILVFYSGVCGFTASSVRAVIMCSVRALSKLIYQKYDSLNSLSFSVIILLAVNPFYIFATGFILSVSAVSGIIFLSRQIKSKLKFLPNKISDAISVGLGAQIATFPALLITFGYVSVVGLVLNLVVLPILSLLYIIMFVCTIICTVIFPIAPYIMPYAALPLEVVINFFVTCGFENGIISGFGSAFIYVSIILFIAAFTDKLNIKLTVRSVIACLSAVVFTFAYIYESVVPSYQLRIIASAYYDGGMVIVKSNEGSVLIITKDLSVVNISTFLNENCLTKPNALIILGDDESLAKYYEWGGDVDAIYLSESLVHASGTDGLTVNYVNKFYLFGVDYEFCDSASLQITFNGVHVGICADEESNLTQTNVLLSVYQLDDVVADEVFYFNPVATDCDCYNIYDCGCLHFKINGDKLKLTDIMPNLRR